MYILRLGDQVKLYKGKCVCVLSVCIECVCVFW